MVLRGVGFVSTRISLKRYEWTSIGGIQHYDIKVGNLEDFYWRLRKTVSSFQSVVKNVSLHRVIAWLSHNVV